MSVKLKKVKPMSTSSLVAAAAATSCGSGSAAQTDKLRWRCEEVFFWV